MRNLWIDTSTGEQRPSENISMAPHEVAVKNATIIPDDRPVGGRGVKFTPPDHNTDWVLVLRTAAA